MASNDSDHRHALVMELVEGETLAARLARGPVSLQDAITIALGIAQALDAAHAQGIVHRDLKPLNVMVSRDDHVKVLDFGLAKAVEHAPAGSGVSNSPTLSIMASQAGIILGTAAYMSPEQAKGLPTDHRSDVFAFGVVLFEMLAGRPPFHGETAPDVMASVLVREPDFAQLPPQVPRRLRQTLKRCLEKQPKKRWHAMADLQVELEGIRDHPGDEQAARSLEAVVETAGAGAHRVGRGGVDRRWQRVAAETCTGDTCHSLSDRVRSW